MKTMKRRRKGTKRKEGNRKGSGVGDMKTKGFGGSKGKEARQLNCGKFFYRKQDGCERGETAKRKGAMD